MIALLAVALANPAVPAADRARFSLWEGQAAPVELSDGRLEREAELLGRGYDGAAERGALKDAMNANALPNGVQHGSLPLAAPADPALFVSVQLNLDPSLGPLKDALADLGASSGFRPDPRFLPMFLGARGDRAAVWGWVPPGRLGEALRVRGVERVEVSRGRLRAPDGPARGRYVVGIRLRSGDADPAPQVFARVTRELAEKADFRWRRTIGYQPVPGSADLALVVLGDVPLRSLSAVLAHPDVVKIRPMADNAIPNIGQGGALPGAAYSKQESFLNFVLRRAPQLFGLTALVVFLTLRRRKRAI